MLERLSVYLQSSSTFDAVKSAGSKPEKDARLAFGRLIGNEMIKTIAFLVIDIFANLADMISLGQIGIVHRTATHYSALKYVALIGIGIGLIGVLSPRAASAIPGKIEKCTDQHIKDLIQRHVIKLEHEIKDIENQRKTQQGNSLIPLKIFSRRMRILLNERKALTTTCLQHYLDHPKGKYAGLCQIRAEMRTKQRQQSEELNSLKRSYNHYNYYLTKQASKLVVENVLHLKEYACDEFTKRRESEKEKFHAERFVKSFIAMMKRGSSLDRELLKVNKDFEANAENKQADRETDFQRFRKQANRIFESYKEKIQQLERPGILRWTWRKVIFPIGSTMSIILPGRLLLKTIDRIFDPAPLITP